MRQRIQLTGTNRPRAWELARARYGTLRVTLLGSHRALRSTRHWVSTSARGRTISGGHGDRDTPVPIPNTAVKPVSADGTWGVAPWESRTPPGFLRRSPPLCGGLLRVLAAVNRPVDESATSAHVHRRLGLLFRGVESRRLRGIAVGGQRGVKDTPDVVSDDLRSLDDVPHQSGFGQYERGQALTARLLADSHSFDALVASVTMCHGVAAACLNPTAEQAAQIAAAKRRVLNDGNRLEVAQSQLTMDER